MTTSTNLCHQAIHVYLLFGLFCDLVYFTVQYFWMTLALLPLSICFDCVTGIGDEVNFDCERHLLVQTEHCNMFHKGDIIIFQNNPTILHTLVTTDLERSTNRNARIYFAGVIQLPKQRHLTLHCSSAPAFSS